MEAGAAECRVIIIIADDIFLYFPLSRIDDALLNMTNAPILQGGFFKGESRDITVEEIIAPDVGFPVKAARNSASDMGSLCSISG